MDESSSEPESQARRAASKKALARELQKIISEKFTHNRYFVEAVADSSLTAKPPWVFGKKDGRLVPRHFYYIIGDKAQGCAEWADVEAVLHVCLAPSEADLYRPILVDLWESATGRSAKAGRHRRDDESDAVADAEAAAAAAIAEREEVTKELRIVEETLARTIIERDEARANCAVVAEHFREKYAKLLETEQETHHEEVCALKAEIDRLEKRAEFVERSAFNATTRLREVSRVRVRNAELQHAMEWKGRERLAHVVATLVARGIRPPGRPRRGDRGSDLRLPAEAEHLLNEPDVDNREPAKALFIRYLRVFLIGMGDSVKHLGIPQKDIDRVVLDGKMPPERTLRALSKVHPILSETYRQLLTDFTSEKNWATANLETVTIIRAPRRQLDKENNADTEVIPLPVTKPVVA